MADIFSGRPASSSQLGAHLLGAVLIGGSIGLTVFTSFGERMHGHTMRQVGYGAAAVFAAAGLFLVLRAVIRVASVHYRVDDTRVEVERGLLMKKIDNLELWRVKDIRFRQGVLQRMLGVGDIELDTTDVSDRVLVLAGIPAGRAVYDRVRDAIDGARKTRGVVAVDTLTGTGV